MVEPGSAGDGPPDHLDREVTAYVAGGGETGLTVELNERAWDRWSLRPRVLRDVSTVDPSVTVLGHRVAHPVFVAPMAGLSWLDPGGEVACAAGARAAGMGFCLSSGSASTLDDVGMATGPFLQQVYLWPERDRMRPFLEACATAGAMGFLLTVDSPPQAARYGFRGRLGPLPFVSAPNFDGGRPPAGSPADSGPADIAWLRDVSGLPVVVKGILRGDDAATALDAGAAGVAVSNHGGRQVDGSITTAEALPEVVEAVGGRGLVLVDGGIRQAEDIVRALALGADAVLVGRPVAWALARGGEGEVCRLLTALADGVVAQMALCGAATAADLTPDLVVWRPWD
ncbi:alpha-hydroxy acid oxidase [Lapillicoccus sp.]|uniref:alpha-hydroxy acid oxidase n=1 Tax=Lapillicoccus sp. TaxID=1909287 RepID=UPI00326523ED